MKSVVAQPATVEVKHVAQPAVYSAVHAPLSYSAYPYTTYNTAVHAPLAYHAGVAPIAYTAGVAPLSYTAPVVAKAASYYANSGGAVHVVKRAADAEADADAYYYGGYPYGYSAYRGYGYAPYSAYRGYGYNGYAYYG